MARAGRGEDLETEPMVVTGTAAMAEPGHSSLPNLWIGAAGNGGYDV